MMEIGVCWLGKDRKSLQLYTIKCNINVTLLYAKAVDTPYII